VKLQAMVAAYLGYYLLAMELFSRTLGKLLAGAGRVTLPGEVATRAAAFPLEIVPADAVRCRASLGAGPRGAGPTTALGRDDIIHNLDVFNSRRGSIMNATPVARNGAVAGPGASLNEETTCAGLTAVCQRPATVCGFVVFCSTVRPGAAGGGDWIKDEP